MRTYTERKRATINLSYALIASVFGFGAAYFAWKAGSQWEAEWWRIFPTGVIAIIVSAFPIYWHFRPNKHPVRRAIGAHGNPKDIGPAVNREMELLHEVFGPFHFTRTYLVYEPGFTLNVIPYDKIVGVEVVVGLGDDADTVVLTTREGKTYEWHRTWIQGKFDPNQVLGKIQSAARL
ncbi:MAG TPA: hypothetical protein VJN89_06125 [Candidatus Acidoferrum sp.]|nr:hypothetical protein [Candidatus Acidoferrum sp.]